ncbi:carotenoid oxygenase family protein [Pseudomonas sp. LS1212]|uniref:carotenoid oxygenase family protein n=1 Tax=Pseudomonas sp. LS1212 TaxID=2972478 RepID=UPI00215C9BF1|nr:carotenoid oxygenase family protein [Pseudomonas sp. LS1212]UVJ45742.1 carotenoid oxygenase family protein [Pseudomonas sp. LS1212]
MPETFYPVASFGGVTKQSVRFEADVFECEVIGEIPKELNGALYRVGGDREFPSLKDDNIINGDGLLSMFRFEDGHVSFKMRYVKTERLLKEREARRRLYGNYRNKFTDDPSVQGTNRNNTANTFAFTHHQRLFALREDSHPYQINPITLDTLPVEHFAGDLKSKSVTAHPKIDPITGEWWSIGLFANGEPTTDMSLHVFDKNGVLIREEFFKTPYPGVAHDWVVTRDHVIFPVMPLTADIKRIEAGGPFYAWDPSLPSMWGIMPRDGKVSDIRWFEIPNVMTSHFMNGFTEGNVVHVDAFVSSGNVFCFFPNVDGTWSDPREANTTLTRLSFDLSKPDDQAITLSPVAGAFGDMPRLDERFAMSKYKFGYSIYRNPPHFGIGQVDWDTKELKIHDMPDSSAQEPLFVPRHKDAPEGDGFILTVVNRLKENRADLVILDGRDVSQPPLATVKLPFNMPFQFHGCFIPEDELKNYMP